MGTCMFSDWKREIFRCGKDIKVLRGGVVLYAAQERPQIDAVTAEKGRFRMKTSLRSTYGYIALFYNVWLLQVVMND